MEFLTTGRREPQLLNGQCLCNKNKTGDSGSTYWECKERRSDNGCGVRITPNQREPSPEPRINSCGKDKDQYEKECQIYLSNHQQHFSKHCRW